MGQGLLQVEASNDKREPLMIHCKADNFSGHVTLDPSRW